MTIKMKHPKYISEALVASDQVEIWQSKGWVADKKPEIKEVKKEGNK